MTTAHRDGVLLPGWWRVMEKFFERYFGDLYTRAFFYLDTMFLLLGQE